MFVTPPFICFLIISTISHLKERSKEPNLAAEAGQGVLSAVSPLIARGDMGGVLKNLLGIW